jgi:hypothetical protein
MLYLIVLLHVQRVLLSMGLPLHAILVPLVNTALALYHLFSVQSIATVRLLVQLQSLVQPILLRLLALLLLVLVLLLVQLGHHSTGLLLYAILVLLVHHVQVQTYQ